MLVQYFLSGHLRVASHTNTRHYPVVKVVCNKLNSWFGPFQSYYHSITQKWYCGYLRFNNSIFTTFMSCCIYCKYNNFQCLTWEISIFHSLTRIPKGSTNWCQNSCKATNVDSKVSQFSKKSARQHTRVSTRKKSIFKLPCNSVATKPNSCSQTRSFRGGLLITCLCHSSNCV